VSTIATPIIGHVEGHHLKLDISEKADNLKFALAAISASVG